MIDTTYCIIPYLGVDATSVISSYCENQLISARKHLTRTTYDNLEDSMLKALNNACYGIYHNPQHLGYIRMSLNNLRETLEIYGESNFRFDTFALYVKKKYAPYRVFKHDSESLFYLGFMNINRAQIMRQIRNRIKSSTINNETPAVLHHYTHPRRFYSNNIDSD